MCGICGIINFDGKQVDAHDLTSMMYAMKNRGPDDRGMWLYDNLGFGHVRLSIIDTSAAGRQPMHSSDGRLTVIFNGEIYNYVELKKELAGSYTFRTNTDTEVLLAAFDRWGYHFMDHLNGMFAFCIHNAMDNSILLARDRFGIKPLYYHLSDNRLIFASEITALLAVSEPIPEPDYQTIYDFMVYNRTCYNERTFFAGVKRLLHGQSLELAGGRVEFNRWYDLSRVSVKPFTDASEYRDLFISAVELSLRSDVPVGISLSGGLDSSAVCSVADQFFPNALGPRFAAVYEKGDACDETKFLEYYRSADLHYVTPSARALCDDLEDFVETLVEPVPGTSEYAEYKIMQEAKRYCTVILTGQGADEQLAGYIYFFGFLLKQLLMEGRIIKLAGEMSAYMRNHYNIDALAYGAYFLLPRGINKFAHYRPLSLLLPEFERPHHASDEISQKLYSSSSIREAVFNHFEYKLEHHLNWSDRSGMRFSMEARFPFLDHRLVEKTIFAPLDQIIGGGQTKLILRQAMEGILPHQIKIRRDKIGFETPEDRWFREEPLAGVCLDILRSNSLAQRGIISQRKVLDLWARHAGKRVNAACDLWKIINLELWFRQLSKHAQRSGGEQA